MNQKQLWAILGIAVALLAGECSRTLFGCEECDRLRALQAVHTTTTVMDDMPLSASEIHFIRQEAERHVWIMNRAANSQPTDARYQALMTVCAAVTKDRLSNHEKTTMAYFVNFLMRETAPGMNEGRQQVLMQINAKLMGQRVQTQTTASVQTQAVSTAPCCNTQPCCKKKSACCSDPKKDKVIQVGGFSYSNACGASFTYQGGVLQNACPEDIEQEQERADYTANRVLSTASFGCHVRQEVYQRSPYWCERYGYPPPSSYRYPMIFQPRTAVPVVVPGVAPTSRVRTTWYQTSADARNPVRIVPPGTPSRGCACPGGNGPNGCECDETCVHCQGLCNAT